MTGVKSHRGHVNASQEKLRKHSASRSGPAVHQQGPTSGFISLLAWHHEVVHTGAHVCSTGSNNTSKHHGKTSMCHLSLIKMPKPATGVKFLGSVSCSNMVPKVSHMLLHLDPCMTKKETQSLMEIFDFKEPKMTHTGLCCSKPIKGWHYLTGSTPWDYPKAPGGLTQLST